MNLTQLRALLKEHGHKTTVEIDRFDVKRSFGAPVSVDVMFTDGNVESYPIEEATA